MLLLSDMIIIATYLERINVCDNSKDKDAQ